MPHATPLISTIAAGFVLAFFLGMLANRLRLSPIVGYLLAGIVIGPFTPGFVGDADLAAELAEIGVILLMFGVGLHFSLKDLLAVKNIAIPGAAVQIAAATLLGIGLAVALGWSLGAGLVFGLALSVASTVVLLRALEDRQLLDTHSGHIAVGWLIVEDLAMVLALVLLPAFAGALGGIGGETEATSAAGVAWQVTLTLLKMVAFVALMLVVGRRAVPWALARVAGTGSRELFTLAVLAIAFGIALGAAALFGVSFALGAFFAGMVLGESDLSKQAGEDSLPLRDAFSVLFFVAVGMLFDPAVLVREPLAVLATTFIIIIGKSLAAYAIVRAFRHPHRTGLLIAASLAQIGEFSFILMNLGFELQILPEAARDLILGSAILSIIANPFVFSLGARLAGRSQSTGGAGVHSPIIASETDHTILVGYGRVGKRVADGLADAGNSFVVVEDDLDRGEELRARGLSAIHGNATDADVLRAANLQAARHVLVAVPNGLEAGEVVAGARRGNPKARIVARAHLDAAVAHLRERGADRVIMGEREIARQMLADCGVAAAPHGLEPAKAS